MTPSLSDLALHHVAAIAETCAREAGTTLEAMFSDSRRRRDSGARAAFFQQLHDSGRWTVKGIAALTGKSEWTVHSAVYQAPRQRAYVKRGYSRVCGGVEVRALDSSPPDLGIAPAEHVSQVRLRQLPVGDGEKKGAAGRRVSRSVFGLDPDLHAVNVKSDLPSGKACRPL